jgi:hypothetical protein
MIDENGSEIQDADSRDIAVVARKIGEIFQRVVIEHSERPSLEPTVGPGRKSLLDRSPHATMLCPRPGCVNVGRVGLVYAAGARNA